MYSFYSFLTKTLTSSKDREKKRLLLKPFKMIDYQLHPVKAGYLRPCQFFTQEQNLTLMDLNYPNPGTFNVCFSGFFTPLIPEKIRHQMSCPGASFVVNFGKAFYPW